MSLTYRRVPEHRETLPLRLDRSEARTDLDRSGCCLVTGLLDPAELDALTEASFALARQERDDGSAYLYGGTNQRVWCLPGRAEVFLRLAENPAVLDLVGHVLGPDPILSNLTLNIAGPGGQAMVPHWDQDWAARPWPHALVSQVVWMLDDFTEENGPTLVAPGSHLADEVPDALVAVTGPRGACMVMDGRTWHGVAANRSPRPRRALLAYYCRPYVRQQENFALSLAPEQQAALAPDRRRLLGIGFHAYLNMVNGPPADLPRF